MDRFKKRFGVESYNSVFSKKIIFVSRIVGVVRCESGQKIVSVEMVVISSSISTPGIVSGKSLGAFSGGNTQKRHWGRRALPDFRNFGRLKGQLFHLVDS